MKTVRSRINAQQYKRQNQYGEPMRSLQKILTEECQRRENYTNNMRPMCTKKVSKGEMTGKTFLEKYENITTDAAKVITKLNLG